MSGHRPVYISCIYTRTSDRSDNYNRYTRYVFVLAAGSECCIHHKIDVAMGVLKIFMFLQIKLFCVIMED